MLTPPRPISQAPVPTPPPVAWAPVILLSAGLLLLRVLYLLFISPYGLAPDEAQYWHWLSHPQLAYVTKPPLTSWLILLSTQFFGDTMLGVRLLGLLAQTALPLLAFCLAQALSPTPNHRSAWLAWGLIALTPLVFVGGLIMSPDALLTPLWLAAVLVTVTRILPAETANQPRWQPWLLVGLLIGLGGLAKASAAFFFPLLGLFFLLQNRATLRRPYFWAAGLVAVACQAPVLLWNAQNHWVSLTHLLWQSAPHDPRHGGFATLLEFLFSQAGVLGPLTLLGLLGVWGLHSKNWYSLPNPLKLLLCLTLPLFAFFVLQTIHAKVQPNWPMLATIPALVLLAVYAAERPTPWLKNLLLAGLVFNLLASVALMDTPLLRQIGVPLRLKIDPTKEMLGWPELGNLTTLYLARMNRHSVILTTRYETAAELAFYTHVPPAVVPEKGQQRGHPLVLYLNPGDRRLTQYDFWPWPADLNNRLVLYVNEGGNLPAAVAQRFGQCHLLNQANIQQGQPPRAVTVRSAAVYLCWQYHGPDPLPPEAAAATQATED